MSVGSPMFSQRLACCHSTKCWGQSHYDGATFFSDFWTFWTLQKVVKHPSATTICTIMYTYCSDVIVCSLDNTSHGACPAMAGRHQELHHGTGAMATGPDWRRGQAPKAWRLTEVQRGIPEVFKLNRWITMNHCLMETYWNILKNRFEMVWVWKLH